MPDREKVIRAVETCFDSWIDKHRDMGLDVHGVERLKREALELLKEQEPIPCGEKIKAGDVVLDFYECGYCKNAIRKPWRYCPFCGKAVTWDA